MEKPLGLRIVETVKRAKSLPVDYLAYKLGASESEITKRLDSLNTNDVLTYEDGEVHYKGSSAKV